MFALPFDMHACKTVFPSSRAFGVFSVFAAGYLDIVSQANDLSRNSSAVYMHGDDAPYLRSKQQVFVLITRGRGAANVHAWRMEDGG